MAKTSEAKVMIDPKKIVLVIVDMQKDFCRGGPLFVQEADELVTPINRIKKAAQSRGSLVFASRCWHPEESIHFNDFAVHCVQNTSGAEFHRRIDLKSVIVISKGVKSSEHGFSIFDGISENGNPFDKILKWNQIELLLLGGVALEYCIAASARDALEKNYCVVLLEDAVRAFDPTCRTSVFRSLFEAGVKRMPISDAIKKFFPKK